jgi:hypothetical protein
MGPPRNYPERAPRKARGGGKHGTGDASSRSRALRLTRSGDARLHDPGEDARKRQQSAEDINVRILKNIALLALVVAVAATLGKYGIGGVGESSRNFAW